MLLRIARIFLSLFLLLDAVAAYGASPDLRLLQLVPPESRIVAGMIGPAMPNQPSSFLLITRNNEFDQEDFLALIGGDSSRSIREAVFVAAASRGEVLGEHSLLVGGHFDREAIFRLAATASARRESYRGVPVLAVPALARERGWFKELRWLAIPDEGVAIFGSVVSVQHELDRWIAKSPADADFVERLSHLDGKEQAWCLLPAPKADGVVVRVLKGLDPRLAEVAGQGGTIQYGIHFGRHIEITVAANPVETVVARGTDTELAAPMGVSYFFSNFDNREADVPKRVVVKIPQRRYLTWLAGYSGAGLATVRF